MLVHPNLYARKKEKKICQKKIQNSIHKQSFELFQIYHIIF